MAFAFGFPEDVTDLIYSMRDWRWEKVRDGGKTPSASCFNEIPPRQVWAPLREFEKENMQPGRTYIAACPEFPEFIGSGQHGIHTYVNLTRHEIPPYHRHWDFETYPDCSTLIKVWSYSNKLDRWTLESCFGPWSETRCPQPKSPAELWWQCEPCAALE